MSMLTRWLSRDTREEHEGKKSPALFENWTAGARTVWFDSNIRNVPKTDLTDLYAKAENVADGQPVSVDHLEVALSQSGFGPHSILVIPTGDFIQKLFKIQREVGIAAESILKFEASRQTSVIHHATLREIENAMRQAAHLPVLDSSITQNFVLPEFHDSPAGTEEAIAGAIRAFAKKHNLPVMQILRTAYEQMIGEGYTWSSIHTVAEHLSFSRRTDEAIFMVLRSLGVDTTSSEHISFARNYMMSLMSDLDPTQSTSMHVAVIIGSVEDLLGWPAGTIFPDHAKEKDRLG